MYPKIIALGFNNTALLLQEFWYLLHMYRGLLFTHTLADLGAFNLVWVFVCPYFSLLEAKALKSLCN